MKKILTAMIVAASMNFTMSNTATAQSFDQKNTAIKVVIPQAPGSGLANIYAHLENFASKKNISMIPVFKPGASGTIGINYAAREHNVLLLSTISDYVNAPTEKNFKHIGVINEVQLTLVASKKSDIKHVDDLIGIEKKFPGKLNWAQTSSAQETMINQLASINNINLEKIHRIYYKNFNVSDIVNGDVDVMFMLDSVARSLVNENKITVVDMDQQTSTRLSSKKNAVAMFASSAADRQTVNFWNNFINDFLRDEEFKELLKKNNYKMFDKSSPEMLDQVIVNWNSK